MKNAVELAPGFRNGLMPSFAAVQTARMPALRLLLALASLIGWYTALQKRAQAVWIVVAKFSIPLAFLAFVLAFPAVYHRRAHLVTAALHVLLACCSQVVSGATLAERAAADWCGSEGALATLRWLAMLCAASGVTSGVACLLAFQLQPVAMAASSFARAAVAASGNGGLCSSALPALPAAAQHMDALYRLLEPLVVPLEPLLLAAGIGRRHPARRCHCVLAALQFWGIGVLPTVVAARAMVARYGAWRAELRRAERQRRREQAEAWGFGFQEPSSSSSSCCASDCGITSSSSEAGERDGPLRGEPAHPCFELSTLPVPPPLLSSLLDQAARRACPRAQHHPQDWQFDAAQSVLRALSPTRSALAAAALLAAAGTAWHMRAFP